MISNFLKKIFGSRNSRILKSYDAYIKSINDLESTYEKKSDEELKALTKLLQDKYLYKEPFYYLNNTIYLIL